MFFIFLVFGFKDQIKAAFDRKRARFALFYHNKCKIKIVAEGSAC